MIVHGHNILVLVSLVVPMIYPFDLERVHSIPLEYEIGTQPQNFIHIEETPMLSRLFLSSDNTSSTK